MAAPSPAPDKDTPPASVRRPYVPTWAERLEDWRVYTGPALAVLLIVAMLGWYVIGHLLPERSDKQKKVAGAPAAIVAEAALEKNIAAWETRFLAAGSGAYEDAQLLADLDELIQSQAAALKDGKSRPDHYQRLTALEKKRDSMQARQAAARSVASEREADQARTAGDVSLATRKLREAYQLQLAANARATTTEEKNVVRETRLRAAVQDAEVVALQAAVTMAQSRVADARSRNDSAVLVQALREERAARAQVNERGPGSRFADSAALKRLDDEIVAVQVADLVAQIAARERVAQQAAENGLTDDAASALASAAELQRRLNSSFPQTRAASAARVDELETRKYNVLAAPLIAEVVRIDREITERLRRGDGAHLRESSAAMTKLLDEIGVRHPRSTLPDPELRNRAVFRWLKQADVAAISTEVRAGLVDVPRTSGLKIFSREVSQSLYQRVMNANPSRELGPDLPVESVTWHEAREFCRRLSWLLGVPVRLPTEREFSSLLTGGAAATWHAGTANGRTHAVALGATQAKDPNTLRDLRGNVAEWLQPSEGTSDTAPIAGGSFLDSLESMQREVSATMDKQHRARHVGFRFVVEAASRKL